MTVTVAETDRTGGAVFEAVEVAMTVTVPAGAVIGAVNIVAVPLAVCARLKVPHGGAAQETVQSTPAAEISFVTVAVKAVPAPAVTELAAAGLKAMEIVGMIAIMAVPLLVLSVVEVAVAVTAPPVGMAEGAV
jgi:hypothetical protein